MLEEKIKSAYEKWLAQPNMPADLAAELHSIAGDEDAITDRFYRELEFGTGGLRGVIGAGTNRMNIYNIRKATQGLVNYLNASGLPKKVAIGYDSRIKSDVFARETAAVLAANGIKAYIYPRLEPTPAVLAPTARNLKVSPFWQNLLTPKKTCPFRCTPPTNTHWSTSTSTARPRCGTCWKPSRVPPFTTASPTRSARKSLPAASGTTPSPRC